MAYTRENYRTKKALREDFLAGKKIELTQPGPFGPLVPDGLVFLEGPHYPEAHKWYVSGIAQDGILVKLNK